MDAVIDRAAGEPKAAASDGQSATNQDLQDLIALDQYRRQKEAAAKKARGLRFTRLVPPAAS